MPIGNVSSRDGFSDYLAGPAMKPAKWPTLKKVATIGFAALALLAVGVYIVGLATGVSEVVGLIALGAGGVSLLVSGGLWYSDRPSDGSVIAMDGNEYTAIYDS